MKKTSLQKNIFLAVALAFVFTAFPAVTSAQWYDYGSTYDTYTDYGSTYDTYADYGSTYDNWSDYGSTYDTYADYGSTYDDWTNYGSTYDNYQWTDYGSTYDNWSDYGSTYDNSQWTDYGSTYDNSYYANNGYSYPVDQPYYGGGYNDPYYQDPYYGGGYSNNGGYYDDCYTDCYNYQPPAPCRNCGGHNPPEYDDLEVECRANPRNAEEGERITWTATADGGNGNYTYSWSEDVSGNARTEYETYNREGTYYGSVRVRSSDGQSATARCSVRVDEEEEEDDDLDVRCEYTPSRPEEDDRVTFRAIVDGGDGDYDYDWSGDVSGDDRTVTKRFTREGRYEAEITVRDGDGNRASDTCEFRIGDNDDDDTNVNLTSTPSLPNPTGTPASLSAVYLSQVPYTGPEDAIKFSLWGIALALFSIVSVREYKKHTYNKLKKNRIEAFKEENKAKLSA